MNPSSFAGNSVGVKQCPNVLSVPVEVTVNMSWLACLIQTNNRQTLDISEIQTCFYQVEPNDLF